GRLLAYGQAGGIGLAPPRLELADVSLVHGARDDPALEQWEAVGRSTHQEPPAIVLDGADALRGDRIVLADDALDLAPPAEDGGVFALEEDQLAGERLEAREHRLLERRLELGRERGVELEDHGMSDETRDLLGHGGQTSSSRVERERLVRALQDDHHVADG